MWTSGANKTIMHYFMKELIQEEAQDILDDTEGYFFNILPTLKMK